MSRPDAERALNIYKKFGQLTEMVVQFLSVARQYQSSTRLEIPKLKHAPTSLTGSLEEYLSDPDFEVNRRQYLATQEAKKSGKPLPTKAPPPTSAFDKEFGVKETPVPAPKTTAAPVSQPKGPAPDLIDFFESIEQNQQPMTQQGQPYGNFQQPQAQPQQFQQTGFVPQQQAFAQQPQAQQPQTQQYSSNPFGQPNGAQFAQAQPQQQPQASQPDFTGAGYGAYTSQPQQQYTFDQPLPSEPQNDISAFSQPQQQTNQPQQQSSNPFRQSSMPGQFTGSTFSNAFSPTSVASPSPTIGINRQSTNPFAKKIASPGQQDTGSFQPSMPFANNSPFTSPPPQQSNSSEPQPLQAQRTGTNPFAPTRSATMPMQPNSSQPPIAAALAPNPTGSTNPFRQSAFVNQETGRGWQNSSQGMIGGGLDGLETQPVFPRPGQQGQQMI